MSEFENELSTAVGEERVASVLEGKEDTQSTEEDLPEEERVSKKQKIEDAVTIVTNQSFMFGVYTGEWDGTSRKPHGEGKWSQHEVLRYDGKWQQGKWTGYGTVYDEDGKRVCSGTFLDGELHGFGTLYEEDGETIETQCYHVFGKEMPDMTNDEEFQQKVAEEEEAERAKPKPATLSTTSFSMTLTSSSPIMSAPIVGLFPRYSEISGKMMQGYGFSDLEDDEIPTPTNLEEGKTREDWMVWVRKFYPKRC